MIEVMGVAMGIDLQGMSREEGSDDLPPGVSVHTPSSPSPSPTTSAPPPPPSQPDVEMMADPVVDDDEAKAKRAAEDAKKAGSEAYRRREFVAAAEHFSKAWDLWPQDVTYLTNLAGETQEPDFLGVPRPLNYLLRSRVL
jgi:stress-induced-phosphoprotein 1